MEMNNKILLINIMSDIKATEQVLEVVNDIIVSVVEVKDNIVLLNVGHTQVRVLKTSISGKLDASTSPSPSA